MAVAKKLPSGSWRCLVYSHTENILNADGSIKKKRIYESFTCDDSSPKGKRQVEKEAAIWAADKERRNISVGSTTLREAIEKYCALKSNVLSPSTLREYKRMKETYFENIKAIELKKITPEVVQEWVNQFSANHKPKTTKNAHGLLTAVLEVYYPGLQLKTTLPQKIKPNLYVPSDNDITALINYFRANDKDMELAVYLAAYGTLRRSEICALTAEDVSNNTIHIDKAMVDAGGSIWTIKTTKTVSSTRYVEMPEFVCALFPQNGRIVNLNPDQVTGRFLRAIKKIKIHHFRFHDLRHYAASIMHALGAPDQYIMERGGWHSDATLKTIYRGTISEFETKYTGMVNGYFTAMQHEIQHK